MAVTVLETKPSPLPVFINIVLLKATAPLIYVFTMATFSLLPAVSRN